MNMETLNLQRKGRMQEESHKYQLNHDALSEVLGFNIIKEISAIADQHSVEAYAVGGFVRDVLINRPSKDIDIVVVGDGLDFAKAVGDQMKGQGKLAIFKNFRTANLKIGGYEIEFVGARKESYRATSRKPIVEEGTLEDDLRRRDFTINALAVSLNEANYGAIVDYFDGMSDLENKMIKTPLDPEQTFSDDPLRMMRAIRFAAQLDFVLNSQPFKAIADNRERISIVSQERITDELNKIMETEVPSQGFTLLHQTSLLAIIFPELEALKGVETIDDKSHKDNFYHSLKVLDNVAAVSDDLWLRWAALLHDIGKPATKKFDEEQGWTFHGHEVVGAKMVPKLFKQLKLPLNEKMRYVKKLVRLHLRPIPLTKDEVTDSAIRRLLYDTGDDLEDLLALCKADITSKNKEKVNRYSRKFDEVYEKIKRVEENDRVRNWQPPITGDKIMETFGIKPSKEVGEIKDAIKEAILDGKIANDYHEAYNHMLKLGQEKGLRPVQ